MDATTDRVETEDTEASKDTEEKILEAALQVFSMKGKDGARMHEIADRAGINKALLHYYFRSKDRLYDKVFEYVIVQLVRSFGTRLRDAQDLDELIHVFVNNYIDFAQNNLAVVRLMVGEHLAGGHRATDRIKTMMESADAPLRVFIDRLEEAVASGEIRPVDPHQTLITVVSASVFFFVVFSTLEAIVPLAAQNRDQFIKQRKDHLTEFVLLSLRPDPRAAAATAER